MKHLTTTILACLTTGTFLLAGTTPSGAAPPSTVVTTRTPMTEVFANRILTSADAAGEVKVQLSNGEVIKMPAKYTALAKRAASTAARVSPDNTVHGNCGSSYITVKENNGWPVHMDTGFTVIHDAISYDWSAQINGFSGSGYEYTYGASGDLDFDSSWHGQHSSHTRYPRGTYHAYVLQPSYALMDTGSICVSGDPYDYANL